MFATNYNSEKVISSAVWSNTRYQALSGQIAPGMLILFVVALQTFSVPGQVSSMTGLIRRQALDYGDD